MNIPNELTKAEGLISVGKFDEAKVVIRGVLADDKRTAQAWYLVSQCISDPKAKAESLRRVLLSDPTHVQANREFDAMNGIAILKPPSMSVPSVQPVKRSASPLLLLGGGILAFVVVIGVIVAPLSTRNAPSIPTEQ